MTTTQFRQPQPGENVIWICMKCNNHFIAPLPSSLFSAKPKCPDCGSRRVTQHPGVVY